MTPVEYRKYQEKRKELHEIILKIMIQYHMEEKDGLRFYYERIAPLFEKDEERSPKGETTSKKKI